MASPAQQPHEAAETGPGPPASRKLKASDLPLPSATRAAIESLAHSFKKEGTYDSIRKQVWDKFEASDYEAQVTKAIIEVAEQEIEQKPRQLLTLDRRKAAALIDGALERSGVYQKAEGVIGQLIDDGAIEARIREIRRIEIGDEAAEAERMRGSKTNEQYAADTQARKAERERLREELKQKEAAIEEEKRRIAKEERRREEREQEQAELKFQAERDERRKLREKEREEREKQRDREREDRHKEREQRDRDRERDRERGRERGRDRERGQTRERERDAPPKDTDAMSGDLKERLTKEENERLEQEALADLLRESSKAARAQPELEVDSALAPPPRRAGPTSAINPIRRDSPKVADSRKLSDRRDAKNQADSEPPRARDNVRSNRSVSRARDKDRKIPRDQSRDQEPGDRHHRDRRSRSPRRDRSRSRPRRDRSRSRRRDDRYDGSRSRAKRERSRRSRSRRRDRSRSPVRSERRQRSRDRDHRSDRRKRSRSRSRRDRNRSRDSRRAGADHYDPRGTTRLSPLRRSQERLRDRERDRDRDTGRERARRSRSRSRPNTSVARPASVAKDELEEWKLEEVRKREKEAKAYLAAQKDAREKGLPVPGVDKPSGKTDL